MTTVRQFPGAPVRPQKTPAPPKDLPATARDLWRNLQREYGIADQAGLTLLTTAARAFARMEEARRLLDKDGCVTRDRWNQVKSHPAAQVERDSRAGLLAALRALHLDVEPIRDSVGRPPGK